MNSKTKQFISIALATLMLTGCSSMGRAVNNISLVFDTMINSSTEGGNVTETFENSTFTAYEKVSEAYLRHDNVGFTDYGSMCNWWQHFNYYHNDYELSSTVPYDVIDYKGVDCYKVQECGNVTSENVQNLVNNTASSISENSTTDAVKSVMNQIGNYLDYDESVTIPYSLDTVVTEKKGICTAYAILSVRVLRKAGYEAEVVRGTVDYDTDQTMKHAWVRTIDKERSTEDSTVYIYSDPTLYDKATSDSEKAIYANIDDETYSTHYHEQSSIAYDTNGFVEVY